jgi:hypothetical protein
LAIEIDSCFTPRVQNPPFEQVLDHHLTCQAALFNRIFEARLNLFPAHIRASKIHVCLRIEPTSLRSSLAKKSRREAGFDAGFSFLPGFMLYRWHVSLI